MLAYGTVVLVLPQRWRVYRDGMACLLMQQQCGNFRRSDVLLGRDGLLAYVAAVLRQPQRRRCYWDEIGCLLMQQQ